ncbi:MAG: PilZ domain-containing protein [Acidobacteria bacterium]|nr:PilZ domain-containing protein [Acidobacteriota bacterium]
MANERDPENEHRTAARYPVRLPLAVKGGVTAEAVTRDVSSTGVLFYVDADIHVGSSIEFSIAMPASVLGTPSDVLVKCVGHVVRVQQEDGRQAVAAVIDEYRFEAPGAAASGEE